MSVDRREAIEYLCRCFLSRENENIEFLREDYEHLGRPVISNLDFVGMTYLEESIVNVGAEIFESRPAKWHMFVRSWNSFVKLLKIIITSHWKM